MKPVAVATVREMDFEDPTLDLPRILCLHGGGTNSTIFRLQCRVLSHMLKSTFRLVYAQAPYPSRAGPDVLSVYKDYGPFRAWLRWDARDAEVDAKSAAAEIRKSLTDAMSDDDSLGATGEWVGLLGFSQGAKIAASLMFSQQILSDSLDYNAPVWPNFRFAVLMAGRGPLVWLLPELPMPIGMVDAAHLSTSPVERYPENAENILRLPTIHVHGLQDPNIALHRELLDSYCDYRSTRLIEWDGNHRLPIKTKDVSRVVDQIMSVAKQTGVVSF
ncbi:citrinin biosynthesis oxidoreductase [Phlyctema vagabunda]|uniref:Citrinin biosynthesis oxidoreductase n=1 Tax=Phlyctema vagabunda TaxID=108571 RepID=A0ABR4PTH8_9HELO